MKKSHEHIVGLLHFYEYDELVTLKELKEHIEKSAKEKEELEKEPLYYMANFPKMVAYSMKEYADKRRNTDLYRFDFCPMCGGKIDWKNIRGYEGR